jgi:hypothetical protein
MTNNNNKVPIRAKITRPGVLQLKGLSCIY